MFMRLFHIYHHKGICFFPFRKQMGNEFFPFQNPVSHFLATLMGDPNFVTSKKNKRIKRRYNERVYADFSE